MLSSLSSQTTIQGNAFRAYEDRWHGSQWNEAAPHEALPPFPSLTQVVRELFGRVGLSRHA